MVDNICGDLDFEEERNDVKIRVINPVVMDRILAAADPVLCDTYVCHLLKYETEEVPYIKMAEKLGVGSADLSGIVLRTCNEQEHSVHVPAGRKIVELQDAVEEVESCSACYGYLIPALDKLKEEGLFGKLKTKICIGQGFQRERRRTGYRQLYSMLPTHPERVSAYGKPDI